MALPRHVCSLRVNWGARTCPRQPGRCFGSRSHQVRIPLDTWALQQASVRSDRPVRICSCQRPITPALGSARRVGDGRDARNPGRMPSNEALIGI